MNCTIIGGGGAIGGTLTGSNAIAGYGTGPTVTSIGNSTNSIVNSGQMVALNVNMGGNQRAGPSGMSLVEPSVVSGNVSGGARLPMVNRDLHH
ncbi:retrotransposon protein, putative, Ty1-copia subclass [Anopheles sinensis]|uniref:Retrotransposon protein, putative, Ty1-copia subclass n=1 Tax=Anopheles sinensis TaxID=74873 RepID=A0A084WBJ1_ANOSI|nr:retrotransposon protein, putative, Ty1-copia subclass [Anopheles sinensis]